MSTPQRTFSSLLYVDTLADGIRFAKSEEVPILCFQKQIKHSVSCLHFSFTLANYSNYLTISSIFCIKETFNITLWSYLSHFIPVLNWNGRHGSKWTIFDATDVFFFVTFMLTERKNRFTPTVEDELWNEIYENVVNILQKSATWRNDSRKLLKDNYIASSYYTRGYLYFLVRGTVFRRNFNIILGVVISTWFMGDWVLYVCHVHNERNFEVSKVW